MKDSLRRIHPSLILSDRLNARFCAETARLFPLLLLLVFFTHRLLNPEDYSILLREDGPIEYLQAVIGAVCGILLFVYAWLLKCRLRCAVVLLMTAVLCFIYAAEEVSWFQRIVRTPSVPTLITLNSQGETNLHNIRGVMPIITRGIIFVSWYCVLSGLIRGKAAPPRLLFPSQFVVHYFWPPAITFTYVVVLKMYLGRQSCMPYPYLISPQRTQCVFALIDQEVFELLFVMGGATHMLFTAHSWYGSSLPLVSLPPLVHGTSITNRS